MNNVHAVTLTPGQNHWFAIPSAHTVASCLPVVGAIMAHVNQKATKKALSAANKNFSSSQDQIKKECKKLEWLSEKMSQQFANRIRSVVQDGTLLMDLCQSKKFLPTIQYETSSKLVLLSAMRITAGNNIKQAFENLRVRDREKQNIINLYKREIQIHQKQLQYSSYALTSCFATLCIAVIALATLKLIGWCLLGLALGLAVSSGRGKGFSQGFIEARQELLKKLQNSASESSPNN